jgi:hypothetical protein
LLQSFQQFGISPRFDNPLALLRHQRFRLAFPFFDVTNFAPRVQAVGIQALKLAGSDRGLFQDFLLAARARHLDVLLLFAQRRQISPQLFQLHLFETGLPLAPAAHSVQRKVEAFH